MALGLFRCWPQVPLGYCSSKRGDSPGWSLGGSHPSSGSLAVPERVGIRTKGDSWRCTSARRGLNASAGELRTNGLERVSPVPMGCHGEAAPNAVAVATVLMDLSPHQALFALSSMLRHFPYAQQQFLKMGGLQVLRSLFRQKGMETLHVRVVTLLYDLIMEKVRSRAGGDGTRPGTPHLHPLTEPKRPSIILAGRG